MLKIEHLLLAPVASSHDEQHNDPSCQSSTDAGVHFRLHLGSRFQGRGIGVRQHLGAAQAVYTNGKGCAGQIHTFCQPTAADDCVQ